MSTAAAALIKYFDHKPTKSQEALFQTIGSFLEYSESKKALLIRGYAGTGKTSVLSALVRFLPKLDLKYQLLAPTGRAAKVVSSATGRPAYTVHKAIYKPAEQKDTGQVYFKKQKNYAKNTIFIVDEASMLQEKDGFSSSGVLSDLIKFVYQDESNALIMLGDDAQLPPVGQNFSPGLDAAYLEDRFSLFVFESRLTEVMRQEALSGILDNATRLRLAQDDETLKFCFQTSGFKDIYQVPGEKIEDGIRYAYDNFGQEQSILICRSNRQANQYNRFIREQILFYQEEIEAGDILMIVKNNYSFDHDEVPGGFIANGDFARVEKIVNTEEVHGLRFATLRLTLIDYPGSPVVESMVILDTLMLDGPSMTQDAYKSFLEQVAGGYQVLGNRKKINEAMASDPYLNALQVKYAYALTCHKAQGGQWKLVFVDQGYLPEGKADKEYMRWLYTAVTRATDQLFLINFHPEFFEEQSSKGT